MKNPTKSQMEKLIECFWSIDCNGEDIISRAMEEYEREYGEKYPDQYNFDPHVGHPNYPNCDITGCGSWNDAPGHRG